MNSPHKKAQSMHSTWSISPKPKAKLNVPGKKKNASRRRSSTGSRRSSSSSKSSGRRSNSEGAEQWRKKYKIPPAPTHSRDNSTRGPTARKLSPNHFVPKTHRKAGKYHVPTGAASRSPMTSQTSLYEESVSGYASYRGDDSMSYPSMNHTIGRSKESNSQSYSVLGRAAGRARGEKRVGFGDASHRTITPEISVQSNTWSKLSGYGDAPVNAQRDESVQLARRLAKESQKEQQRNLRNRRRPLSTVPEIGGEDDLSMAQYPQRTKTPPRIFPPPRRVVAHPGSAVSGARIDPKSTAQRRERATRTVSTTNCRGCAVQ